MLSRYAHLGLDAIVPVYVEQEPDKTSIKHVSKAIRYGIKNGLIGPNRINLDIGGGKWDLGTNAIESAGGKNILVDPYARSHWHNADAIMDLEDNYSDGVDTVTLSSVLNVIPYENIRLRVIQQAFSALKNGGTLIVVVHEGDKSGINKITGINTYQANLKTAEYKTMVQEVFGSDNVTKQGNVMIAVKRV